MSKQLRDAFNYVDNKYLAYTEVSPKKKASMRYRWFLLATCFCIALGGLYFMKDDVVLKTYAVEMAEYPEVPKYPNMNHLSFEQDYDVWRENQKMRQIKLEEIPSFTAFLTTSLPTFLISEDPKNLVYSPVNVYITLAMLSELTEGQTKQQILTALNTDSSEDLNFVASQIWNSCYQNDGATTSILANSLWLDENLSFNQNTLTKLAREYYVSSFQGKMGDADFNKAYRQWLNEQTDYLLEKEIAANNFDINTILALASTINYKAKWEDEFKSQNNEQLPFYSNSKEINGTFMKESDTSTYYWSEHFGATFKNIENGGKMWFILPDEEYTPNTLLKEQATLDFIKANGNWENNKRLIVNLAVPKFDISSSLSLNQGLRYLGITDVFKASAADFTPLTELDTIFLSKVKQDARVKIDEEGISAVAYTEMQFAGAAMPPKEEVDFILNRPFIFVITSNSGLPLFIGIVENPF